LRREWSSHGGEPAVDLLVERRERHAATEQDLIMEGFYVEAGSQRSFGALSQLEDLELPYLVGEGLSWVGDVTLHFGGRLHLAHGRVIRHPTYTFFDSPPLRVDPGVDHQPVGAQDSVVEMSIVLPGILVEAHFLAEGLGVQTPTFHVGVG
jgi:hypothetical protein